MRDNKRIKPFLNKLQEVWEQYPDLRFGQLVSNLDLSEFAMFNIEDDDFLKELEKTYKESNSVNAYELENFIEGYFSEYEITANLSDEFSCYPLDGEINFAIFEDPKELNDFYNYFINEFFENKGLPFNQKITAWTVSFLHELGHVVTETSNEYSHIFTDELLSSETLTRASIEELMKTKQVKLANEIYRNLTTEKLASQWAADYIQNNYSRVKYFQQYFQEELKDFLERIGYEEKTN